MPSKHGFITFEERLEEQQQLDDAFSRADAAVREVLAEFAATSHLPGGLQLRQFADDLAWGIGPGDGDVVAMIVTVDLDLAGTPPRPWLEVAVDEDAASVPANVLQLPHALQMATMLPTRLKAPQSVWDYHERRQWEG